MKKVFSIVAILLTILMYGCIGKSSAEGFSGGKATGSSTTDASGLKEVQLDFNGHSSEGGSIYAYYDKETLKYFEVYLFGEQGKVVYRFDFNAPDEVAVLRSEYGYDKPITEGDVKITSQTDSRYAIRKDQVYSVSNGQESLVQGDLGGQLVELFNSTMKIIKNGNSGS